MKNILSTGPEDGAAYGTIFSGASAQRFAAAGGRSRSGSHGQTQDTENLFFRDPPAAGSYGHHHHSGALLVPQLPFRAVLRVHGEQAEQGVPRGKPPDERIPPENDPHQRHGAVPGAVDPEPHVPWGPEKLRRSDGDTASRRRHERGDAHSFHLCLQRREEVRVRHQQRGFRQGGPLPGPGGSLPARRGRRPQEARAHSPLFSPGFRRGTRLFLRFLRHPEDGAENRRGPHHEHHPGLAPGGLSGHALLPVAGDVRGRRRHHSVPFRPVHVPEEHRR